jgi:hypothetical protein
MLDFGCPVFPLWKEKFRLIERIIKELSKKHFLYIDAIRGAVVIYGGKRVG